MGNLSSYLSWTSMMYLIFIKVGVYLQKKVLNI